MDGQPAAQSSGTRLVLLAGVVAWGDGGCSRGWDGGGGGAAALVARMMRVETVVVGVNGSDGCAISVWGLLMRVLRSCAGEGALSAAAAWRR